MLIPLDIDSDEDFDALSDADQARWQRLMRRCYQNYLPRTFNGIDLPANCILTSRAQLCGRRLFRLGDPSPQNKKRADRLVTKLAQAGWISVTSAGRHGIAIALTKSPRWQNFGTYRRDEDGTTAGQPRDNRGNSNTPSPSPSPSEGGESKPPPSQPSLPNVKKTAVGRRHYAAAGRLRKAILSHYPDHPCGLTGEWKATQHKWAQSARAAEQRGRDLEQVLDNAEWGLANGYTIGSMPEALNKEGRILQHRAGGSERRSAPADYSKVGTWTND